MPVLQKEPLCSDSRLISELLTVFFSGKVSDFSDRTINVLIKSLGMLYRYPFITMERKDKPSRLNSRKRAI